MVLEEHLGGQLRFYGLEQPEIFSNRELGELFLLTIDIQHQEKWHEGTYRDYVRYLGNIKEKMVLNDAQYFTIAQYIARILNV